MKRYPIKSINDDGTYLACAIPLKYKANYSDRGLIKEILSAPSNISDLEKEIDMFADCGSCPSCACIEGDLQFLAVIEAPATVPLLVLVGGLSFTS